LAPVAILIIPGEYPRTPPGEPSTFMDLHNAGAAQAAGHFDLERGFDVLRISTNRLLVPNFVEEVACASAVIPWPSLTLAALGDDGALAD
jgi:hypothetical protein